MFESILEPSVLSGLALSAVVFVVLVFCLRTKLEITARIITYSSICLAIAIILSRLTVFRLPQGGSLTLCSMLFICLVGYWFGTYYGLLAGFVYGLIDLILGPIYVVHPVQLFLDYMLGFSVLGFSGLMRNKKHGLFSGYVLGCFSRLFVSTLSGYIFFMDFINDPIGSIFSSISYNSTYILPEMFLTLILISIPALNKAINTIKHSSFDLDRKNFFHS